MRGESAIGDGEEVFRLQARSTDQRAIDMLDAKYIARIRGLDRPSIEDAPCASAVGTVENGELAMNETMHWACCAAGTVLFLVLGSAVSAEVGLVVHAVVDRLFALVF